MKRQEAWLMAGFGVILILLYLLSSTNLIIKERKTEIYPVSVILDDTTDESYQNFKKGVDRAAIELNADVSLITLYEGGDARQQIERMAREQQNGAKALIVMPVAENELEEALAEKRIQIPLVLVNSELPRDKVSSVVTADFDAMGRNLAKQVLEEHGNSIPVYLFYSHRESAARQHFQDGVETVLQSGKCEIKKFERHGDGTFRKAIEELVYPEPARAVIIALDPESLLETAAILADSSVYPEHVDGLYGRGTTTPVLNYLDRGVINGLCVTDDFSTGYLSVKRAVEILANQKLEGETVLDSYYIQKDDLRKPEFEKMLYPIE